MVLIMRTLTDHKVNGLNEAITIAVIDDPGPGGANHRYTLSVPRTYPGGSPTFDDTSLEFQNGPIATPSDFNGITNEALLAVLIDRMRGFQYKTTESGSFDFKSHGKFSCRENALVLTHLEEALMWLQKRTRDRMARAVEGTMAP
jgi:hypothetical protein